MPAFTACAAECGNWVEVMPFGRRLQCQGARNSSRSPSLRGAAPMESASAAIVLLRAIRRAFDDPAEIAHDAV